MRYNFKQQSRLTNKYEYTRVFKKAEWQFGVYWTVLARDTKQPLPRLGLAISKRILKRAVDRNYYKRIAREVFRLNQHQLSHLDFVVIARKKYQTKAHKKQLHHELLNLLSEYGL